MSESKSIILKNVVIMFPEVYTPSSYQTEADKAAGKTPPPPKYKSQIIIRKDHPQFKELLGLRKSVGVAKFGDQLFEALRDTGKTFLRDGNQKRDQETGAPLPAYADAAYFTASNKARPTLVDRRGQPVPESEGLFHTGSICNVEIEVWAQQNKHGKRVNATLLGIQFVEHGEGGAVNRVSKPGAFEVLDDEFSTEGAAGDADDDDIPF